MYWSTGPVRKLVTTGMSALPDMSAHISGNAQVPVLQLICYTSGTLKICLNLLLTALPIYITRDSNLIMISF